MSKKQTSPQQFRAMVDFMVDHPDIATGTSQQRPEEQNRIWEELNQKLNSISVSIRDVPAWKKVWRDFKANTKKKMVTNKQQMVGTGGGPNKTLILNDLEEAVSSLLNLKTSVHGLPNIATFGIDEPMENVIYLLDDDNTDKLDSSSQTNASSSAKKRKTEKSNPLQQQIALQQSFFENYIALKKEELLYLKKIADGIQSYQNK